MLMLDNQADADNALALARSFTAHCFIGRDNQRADRASYIVEYWKGGSGAPTLPNEDCSTYDPSTVQLKDDGAARWCAATATNVSSDVTTSGPIAGRTSWSTGADRWSGGRGPHPGGGCGPRA
jgi:hypothetical protein